MRWFKLGHICFYTVSSKEGTSSHHSLVYLHKTENYVYPGGTGFTHLNLITFSLLFHFYRFSFPFFFLSLSLSLCENRWVDQISSDFLRLGQATIPHGEEFGMILAFPLNSKDLTNPSPRFQRRLKCLLCLPKNLLYGIR